ncbi:MAG: hypothetical protein QNJ22_22645 [Desulfosarcinaceae bacterium]|nr:hypothetical protein [Desulfosarcinaceae bacterium]
MRKRFFILWLLLAALPLTSMPAVAGSPATRPLDVVLNYQLHGVSLAMSVAQACATLEKNGFTSDDPDTPASDRLFWTYRRDNFILGFQRLADDETLVVNITATLLPEKGQEVDIGAEAKRIMASWGSGTNDKEDPVCITREGAVKGKALFGQCAVRDTTKKAAGYQATIVRNQSVEILTHAAPARK